MKKLVINLALLVIITGITSSEVTAQDLKNFIASDSAIKSLIDKQQFTFVAETANPMTGGSRHLSSYYDVKISGDTVVAALPYFGRAYSVPINPSVGGINFASAKFDYEMKERKKGGWEIGIKFKDESDARQFSFTIFKNGSAILNVISNNRQPISYNGKIRP